MAKKNNPFEKYLSVEDKEHIKVVEFCNANLEEHIVWFHIPNGGKKSAFEAYRCSLMGERKGAHDFVFLYPKFKSVQIEGKGYKEIEHFGLTIELKAPEHERVVKKGKKAGKTVKAKGKASDEQIQIAERLNKVRYKSVICYGGADEAIHIIKDYFSLYDKDF